MPDAPADDSSEQATPKTPVPYAPGPDVPVLPEPPLTRVMQPAPAESPAAPEPHAEPPTADTPFAEAEPPTLATPHPAAEPPTLVPPLPAPEAGGRPSPAPPWPAPWPPTAYSGPQAAGYPPAWTGAAPPPPGFVYPGIGAPAPKRSPAAAIISVVAVVVVLACLGFGTAAFFAVRHLDAAPVVNAPVPTDYPTDLPTDDPTPDAEPTHDGDLKRYVIGRPATAHAWPKVKAEEALNLTGAAANFSDPAEGKLVLQRYGFKDGYTRRWIDQTGSYLIVRVLRFADASGGDNFASFYIHANEASGWGEPDDVPGVPEAAGFVKPKPEKNGFQRSMAVGDATDIVAIVIADQPPPASPSIPDAVLSDEFGLL